MDVSEQDVNNTHDTPTLPSTRAVYYTGFDRFVPASLTNFGFSISESNETIEVGATTLFFVTSDVNGIIWNKNVPCQPQDFIWYFEYREE